MRKFLILLSLLLCFSGCSPSEPTETPTPTPEVTASPTPSPATFTTPTENILSAATKFMFENGYETDKIVQLGETYMTPEYMMAVIFGTYYKDGITYDKLHLAHLDFKDGGYQVINMYPGEEDKVQGFYPNVININGETIIWTTIGDDLQANKLRVYYESGSYEDVPITNEAAIYRFYNGVVITKLAPLDANGEEISYITFRGDALQPLANITHSMGVQVHPMTGEVLGVCDYPTVPDIESKIALTDALQKAGLLNSRADFTLLAAKEYSGRLYTCISYTANGEIVYELVVGALTVEGNIEILGTCKFAPPTEKGYQMYSTAIENDIICWTLLNEMRLEGETSVLMDFNAFRFYWENGDPKDDLVVDRFFVYVNRHVPLPTRCVPIVNGKEIGGLASQITRVEFNHLS